MTNEELMKQIKELKAQIKKLQREATLSKKPTKRALSDELIEKYGERIGGVTLTKKDGIRYNDEFFGAIAKSYSIMVRRRLFPEQIITKVRGDFGHTSIKPVECLNDDQYELYSLYMEQLLEFLIEVDDALRGEAS